MIWSANDFGFLFLLIPTVVFGHLNKRYSGTTGTMYNVLWYLEIDLDSVGQCASLCTYHECNLFETLLLDDQTFTKSRGFRCKVNVGTLK